MREHILDRLAYLADMIIATPVKDRPLLAMAAISIAVTHHRVAPPAEGSP